jgi:hypothetical protein
MGMRDTLDSTVVTRDSCGAHSAVPAAEVI